MLEEYVYKAGKKLRCGYTTGTCAAAAAKAAALMLFSGKMQKQVSLLTPGGIPLVLEVTEIDIQPDAVSCAVKKDSGDDPDITNGILVYAKVKLAAKQQKITIDGGIGIGRVTKNGLDQPVGNAAINAVPRKMIEQEVEAVCDANGYEGGMQVMISIPAGAELAKKTFNPRLGIEGGLSVLGTSGIVEPMSEAALLETIAIEMKQKLLAGRQYVLAAPGNYGVDFVRNSLQIELDDCVKCSNFIGDALDKAIELQAKGFLLVGHIGKLVKLGAGIMNTHSRCADARLETLSACTILAGGDALLAKQVLLCTTTEEALDLLEQGGILKATMEQLMKRIAFHLSHRAGENMLVGAVVFSNRHGILGYAGEAERLLALIKAEVKMEYIWTKM